MTKPKPAWLDTGEPHMDGSVTYTMPKYHNRPGTMRVTLPAPVVASIYAALEDQP